MRLIVEGHKNLVRDPHSKAILLTGRSAEMEAHQKKNARLREMENRIETLERIILEIRGMTRDK